MRILQIKTRGLELSEKIIDRPSLTIFGKERGDSEVIFVIVLSQNVIAKRALFLHIFNAISKLCQRNLEIFCQKPLVIY